MEPVKIVSSIVEIIDSIPDDKMDSFLSELVSLLELTEEDQISMINNAIRGMKHDRKQI